MKKCNNCGTEIPVDSLFCLKCGAKQLSDEFEATPAVTEEECASAVTESPDAAAADVTDKKPKRGKRIVAIIRNSAIMAVALLLLIGSFLPISIIKSKDVASTVPGMSFIEDSDIEFGLNTFQYITLFFDSFYDVEDIEDLEDLYDYLSEISEEFEDFEEEDYEELNSREKGLLNEAFYVSIRMLTRMDQSGTSASLVFSAMFGIVNILFSVALFVVALLNLIATFNILKRFRAQLYTWTLILLTAAPAIILAAHYVGHLYTGGGMYATAILSVICVVSVVIAIMILRYIFTKMDTVRNIIARSTALVLSVVVMCLAFAPVFSASFKRETSRTVTVSYGAEFFENLAISDGESEHFEELVDMSKKEKRAYFEDCMKRFTGMSKKEIQSSYGAKLNAPILVDLLGSKFEIFVLNLLSVTVLFFIFTVISVLLVFWQSLYFFAAGKHVNLVVVISKICAAATAVIAMILAIVLVAITASFAKDYIGSSYSVSIGAGVITMAIFSIGAIFCPAGLVKKAKKAKPSKVERVYDNVEDLF